MVGQPERRLGFRLLSQLTLVVEEFLDILKFPDRATRF
jgi:hypothetical protein